MDEVTAPQNSLVNIFTLFFFSSGIKKSYDLDWSGSGKIAHELWIFSLNNFRIGS